MFVTRPEKIRKWRMLIPIGPDMRLINDSIANKEVFFGINEGSLAN
jgi:hypothetical protein